MYFKYRFASFHIRTVNRNLTVKTSWTKQRRVKNICTVCSCYDNNTFVAAKTIHFYEQLVERLFTFVMATAKSGATLTTYSINLIDKDDTWCIFLRIFEQIPYTGSTNTDEHFYEVGTGDAKERNACFPGYRTSKQCFTSSRRTYQKYAFRDSRAYGGEFARIFQEINNFDKLLLLFVGPCNIFKCNFFLLFIIETGFTLTEVHYLTAAALRLIKQEEEENEHNS
ncbi:hypothetical protein D3C81_700440 [compost metagenome]